MSDLIEGNYIDWSLPGFNFKTIVNNKQDTLSNKMTFVKKQITHAFLFYKATKS